MAAVFGLATTPGCFNRTEAEMGKNCELSKEEKAAEETIETTVYDMANDKEMYACKKISVTAKPLTVKNTSGHANLFTVLIDDNKTISVLYSSHSGDIIKTTRMETEVDASIKLGKKVKVEGRFNGAFINAENFTINEVTYTEIKKN